LGLQDLSTLRWLGTNWPVDRLFGSYSSVVGAYRALFADLSLDEQRRLFYRNAAQVYGIDEHDLDLDLDHDEGHDEVDNR